MVEKEQAHRKAGPMHLGLVGGTLSLSINKMEDEACLGGKWWLMTIATNIEWKILMCALRGKNVIMGEI